MSSALGLAELLLVLLGVMGWGAYELWSLERSRRRKGDRGSGSKAARRDPGP